MLMNVPRLHSWWVVGLGLETRWSSSKVYVLITLLNCMLNDNVYVMYLEQSRVEAIIVSITVDT